MEGELTSLTSGASQTRVRVHFLLLKSCVSPGRLRLEAQSSIQIVRERWRLLSITVGQNRPHLGLCPGFVTP